MPDVDMAFRLTGTRVPVDHGYALYSAVSRVVPGLHGAGDVGVHPIRGRYAGRGTLCLTPSSRLVIRLGADQIRAYLPLAGSRLDVDGCRLRVGVPEVRALRPTPALYARLVTIKGFLEPAPFLEAVWRQLQRLAVTPELHIGERRTLRVKDRQVVGFEVVATGLRAEESLRLQGAGVGGRRHMGCGVFLPLRRQV